MQISDRLMQMALQSAWQMQDLPAAGKTADNSASGSTSFRDLLEQRRGDAATAAGQTDDSRKTGTAADSEPQTQPADDTTPDANTLALGQALVAEPFVLAQPVQTAPAAQPDLTPVQTTAVPATLTGETAPLAGGMETAVPVPAAPQQTPAQTDPAASAMEAQPELSAPVIGAEPSGEAENAFDGNAAQTDARGEAKPQAAQTQAAVQSWQTPLFREVQSAPVRVGDSPVDMTAPAGEVRSALTRTLKQAVEQGDDFVQIRLSPENLGTVVAEFTRNSDGALHVVLRAENGQTARLLSDHASALGTMLQDSIHSEVRVEVPRAPQDQAAWQQPDQGGGRQQQQQQQQQRAPRQEAESFLHQLRLGLVSDGSQAV